MVALKAEMSAESLGDLTAELLAEWLVDNLAVLKEKMSFLQWKLN
jgi:hypothetical protein